MGPALAGAGILWIAVAADAIVESIRAATSSVRFLGQTIVHTTPTGESVGIAILAFGSGVVATFMLRALMGSHLTAVVRREVDRRWNEMSVKSAGVEARNELLLWRIEELQRHLRELVGKRDDMLEEMSRIETRAKHLREDTDEGGADSGAVIAMPELAERDPG